MYQKIIIIGNLGGDPEMRYMPDGTAVTSFSVATSRKWTNKATGEPVTETTWWRISVWGRQAETSNEYLSSGKKVLVEGVLQVDRATGSPRTYTRQDGTIGVSLEIRADLVRFLSGRNDTDDYTPVQGGGSSGDVEEDEIPF